MISESIKVSILVITYNHKTIWENALNLFWSRKLHFLLKY